MENEIVTVNIGHNARKVTRRRIPWGRLMFLAPALVYVLLIFIYPIIYNLAMSFEDYTMNSIINGTAPFVGFENYAKVLSNSIAQKTVWNTIAFTIGCIAFQFSIGLGLAIYFKRQFPLSQFLRTILLIPWLLPLIVSGTVWRWILDGTNGILNQFLLDLHVIHQPLGWLVTPQLSLLAVILTNIWVGIPFNMVLLYSGLQDIPEELYEAGAIDGANGVKSFWYITLPSLRPVIAIVLMLGLIYTLKAFDIIMVLTNGGPANSSQTLSTWSYALSFTDLSFGQGAAVGNIMMVISLVFSLIYLRITRSSER